MISPVEYVHGYDPGESERLDVQANLISELVHSSTKFERHCRILEVGCGTGAQTISLARNNPTARIVAFDRSPDSLARASARLAESATDNVDLIQADVESLSFEPESFDHAFVCFVLEHLESPLSALRRLRALIRPGGSITVFEGDHGSTYFSPDDSAARRAIDAQAELQRRAGGNAMVGRQVYPLLAAAGYRAVRVQPCVIYVDGSRPDLADAFTRQIFTAMIAGVRERVIDGGLIEREMFDDGLRALGRAAEEDGVFSYTFFKAHAMR
ncbi:MAG TPA: methyltransferase domain-containing protein [Polyangiales bacterium]